MTPDEIRKLTPGPELDRVVGETLFACEPGPLARLQRYSTTWAGLGLIVEEMRRRLFAFGCQEHEAHWRVMFEHLTDGLPDGLAARTRAGTIFEATAKAALLALAAQKGQQP